MLPTGVSKVLSGRERQPCCDNALDSRVTRKVQKSHLRPLPDPGQQTASELTGCWAQVSKEPVRLAKMRKTTMACKAAKAHAIPDAMAGLN